jgi:tripartite-type tricarboxylate transporter receptor subunit TctC
MAAAVVGGEAQWCIAPAAALVGHIKSGRVRALAISSKQRSLLLPDIPTVDEAGVPGYEYASWNGVFVPRGTSRAAIDKLHASIQKALADPDVVKAYAAQGMTPAGSETAKAFDRYFRGDFERITKLVQVAGIKPE